MCVKSAVSNDDDDFMHNVKQKWMHIEKGDTK